MKINHLSVSRTQTFDSCQQLYKFRYHLEIPPIGPEEPYFLYGKVVHKIIEEYTSHRGAKPIQEIKKDVLHGVIPLDGANKEIRLQLDYARRLPNDLKSFLQINEKIGNEGEVEWDFNYDLDPPHQKCLVGYIDRLIRKDDQFFIIDYKTTKKGFWRKDVYSIKSDLQLQCYALVVMRHFNVDPENIKCALFYLDGGNLIGAKFSRQTLETTERYMLNIYNKIAETDPDTVVGRVGSHCARCGYRKVCQWYSLT